MSDKCVCIRESGDNYFCFLISSCGHEFYMIEGEGNSDCPYCGKEIEVRDE